MKKKLSFAISTSVKKAAYLFLFLPVFCFSQRVNVTCLIVGGGGGGGTFGGGGAGGVQTVTASVAAGTYNIVVGVGGAAGIGSSSEGSDGGNSSAFSNTSYGGGGGGAVSTNVNGLSGGSGGGGSGFGTGSPGNGTAGEGNTGGYAGSAGGSAGGGGGAGTSGGNGVNTSPYYGGAGGTGIASSISGSSIYYGGGGAGGGDGLGLGGNGGGGNGASYYSSLNAQNGTANTGGGGGGGYSTYFTAGHGGSGVVILSFVTGSLTYTTTGAVTTSGGNTIVTFDTTGTFNVSAVPTLTISPSSTSICIGSSTSITASGASTYTWSPSTGLSSTSGSSVTANPTTTTTYSVSGTTSGGYVITNVITVTVNSLPILSISPSTPVIFDGLGTTITASGANTYSWAPATNLSAATGTSVTATPSVTTGYTLTGTSAAGCISNLSFYVSVELWKLTADTANAPIYYKGNVGIGNNNPQMPLDVTGNARVSGNLYVGGGFIESSKVSVINSLNADSVNALSGVVNFGDTVKMHKPVIASSNIDAKSLSFGGTPAFTFITTIDSGANGATKKVGNLSVAANTNIMGNLNVSGGAQFDSLGVGQRLNFNGGQSGITYIQDSSSNKNNLLFFGSNSQASSFRHGTTGGTSTFCTALPTTGNNNIFLNSMTLWNGLSPIVSYSGGATAKFLDFSFITSGASIDLGSGTTTDMLLLNSICGKNVSICTNGGQVGIGTANPAATLHVNSNTSSGGSAFAITNTTGSTLNNLFSVANNGGTSIIDFSTDNNPLLYIVHSNGSTLQFLADGTGDITSSVNFRPHFGTGKDFSIYEGTTLTGSDNLTFKIGTGGTVTVPELIASASNLSTAGISLATPFQPLMVDANGMLVSSAQIGTGGGSSASGSPWVLGGNSGAGTSNILGTGDNTDLIISAGVSSGVIQKRMLIENATGNIGIGPAYFHGYASNTGAYLEIGTASPTYSLFALKDFNLFPTHTWSHSLFEVTQNGTTYIGNTRPTTSQYTTGLRLAVEGTIVTKEIYVETSDWADYVFANNYKLQPLSEVEKFVTANHHLPNIPAASEVEKDGQNIGKLQVKQMEKIEELTLYLIELNKKIDTQHTEIEALQSQNQKLGKELAELKNK